MDDQTTPKSKDASAIFVEEMFAHAQDLLIELRSQGTENSIKDRITCLKYLEEITKTYMALRKADDSDAAGSAVRKYASAFAAKSPTSVGKGGKRKRAPAPVPEPEPDDLGGDGADADAA